MTASCFLLATLLTGQVNWQNPPPVVSGGSFVESPALPQSSTSPAAAEYAAPLGPLGAPALAPRSFNAPASAPRTTSPAAPAPRQLGPPWALPEREPEPAPLVSQDPPATNWQSLAPRGRTVHAIESADLPVSHQAPVAPTKRLAGALIQRALAPPQERALRGRPLVLVDAISKNSNRLDVVHHYWEAAMEVAEYHSALDEYARLANLPLPQAADQRTLLSAAQAASRARVDDCQLQAQAAQFALADATGASQTALPPLPTELPLTVPYRTHFDTLFAGRTAPVALRRIHDTLPLVQRAVQSRAEAVLAAEEAAGLLEEGYRRGTADLPTLLAVQDAIRQQRRWFFRTVLDYNKKVAEYTLNVVDEETPVRTLVTTLVESPVLAAAPNTHSAEVISDDRVVPTAEWQPVGEPRYVASPYDTGEIAR